MNPNHSDRACALCRQRRVRCDKALPTCRRCTKFGQPCPGYPARQRFIDQSNSIRNRLKDEVSSSDQRIGTSVSISRFTSIGSESRTSQHRVNETSRVSTVSSNCHPALFAPARPAGSTTNEAATYIPTRPSSHTSAQHTPTTSLPLNAPHEHFGVDVSMQQLLEDSGSDYFDLDIESYYANGTNACGFFPGVPVTLPPGDEFSILNGMHDPKLISSRKNMSVISGDSKTSEFQNPETDVSKEVALLVHLFVEFLAPWMDLFDIDAYFTRVLPSDVMPNILLQSAVAAVAAKQIARHVMNGCAESASKHYGYLMANYQNVSSNEWFYKAACYYDRGISHLRIRLQQSSAFVTDVSSSDFSTRVQTPLRDNLDQSSIQGDPGHLVNKQPDVHHLFSAISVLSLYESLDDCFATSSQHLPGFLALFDKTNTPSLPRSLAAGRAAFWYFARKEALASYAHHDKPKIDPSNMTMWIAAGLPFQVFNFLSSEASDSHILQSSAAAMCEDRDATPCALIWILVKVIDLIAPDDKRMSTVSRYSSTAPLYDATGSNTQTEGSLELFNGIWIKVREWLKQWYDHRLSLFVPHAVVDTNSPYGISGKPLRVAFFTSPTGAAVSQLYHFIQILLLINQPSSQGDHGSRLRMLKDNSTEVEFHSREICAIALGRQPLAIQRHMSHPLQLAGTYFETKEERDAILELLREIAVESSSPLGPPH